MYRYKKVRDYSDFQANLLAAAGQRAGANTTPTPAVEVARGQGNRTVRCGVRDVTAVERQQVAIKLFGFAMTLLIFAA